ncbi:hypothetical protein V565_104390 [Rhizoctonia solani 123E]|uniref:MYND finger protein n=1 Tax=Rhizoctonia solani 123E TaxID=1423351 RepID=A0A074SGZ1_9AGAM|nr:hypothetical protein V565_104390 [Rhizoctonia solani 123E]
MALQEYHSWGRPLDQYVASYARDKTTSRLPELDDTQRLSVGRKIVEQICLAAHDPAPSSGPVSVSDLYTVLSFSRSPAGYSLFSNPRLISGCICLMSRLPLSQSGRQAPFSYEYGYLCFRILTVALGMCILDRREGHFQLLMKDMATYADVEPIRCFSRHVRGVVAEHVNHSAAASAGRNFYSCILGWRHCSECPKMTELVSRSDASTLLGMIWDDDKQFMKAMLWTYSPGLSGLVYLLWNYVHYEQYLKDHPHPDRFMIPFVDVFFRCVLCSTPDQALALSIIRVWNFRASHIWKNAPVKVRSELADSRLMMQAYINQLNLGIVPTDDDDTSLPIEDIPDTLHFLHRHFVSGCEDLIPALISTTIQRCWVTFLNLSGRSSYLVELRGVFSWFRAFIGHLGQPTTTENVSHRYQVLTHTMDSDLVGLIGYVMLFINATSPSPKESEDSEKLLKECENVFIELSYLPPGRELEDYFIALGVGWWKVYWHLRHLARISGSRSNPSMFYSRCAHTWAAMRPSIDPEDLVTGTEYFTCSYGRCPDPKIPWGLEYVCEICLKRIYCSTLCHQRDREWGEVQQSGRARGTCVHPLR